MIRGLPIDKKPEKRTWFFSQSAGDDYNICDRNDQSTVTDTNSTPSIGIYN